MHLSQIEKERILSEQRGVHDYIGTAGSIPVRIGTESLVARDEDRNKDTIPMPTFARRPSAMSSSFPVDIAQGTMVGQQRQQISEMQFDKVPTPSTLEQKAERPSQGEITSQTRLSEAEAKMDKKEW